jgi:formiminotetrahydrofolate cyclodeaminase
MTVKELKKKNNMGRSYNLKNSPINKGTAAKPSPVKLGGLGVALVGSAASGLITGVSNLIGGAKRKKEMKKLQAQNRKDSIIENMDAFNKDLTGASAKTNILDD